MPSLTPAQNEAWRLVEGYCDAGLSATKNRVAELLDCNESDVDTELAALGLERCGECRVWHSQADCAIDHPDDSTLFICQSCAEHLEVDL